MSPIPTYEEERALVRELREVVREGEAALDEILTYGRTDERAARLAQAEEARASVLRRLAVLPLAPERPAVTPLADALDEHEPIDSDGSPDAFTPAMLDCLRGGE